jgi:hypothetical protein
MWISWNGRGWVVFAITFASLVVTELSVRSYFHDHSYYQHNGWPKLAGFLLAAALVRLALPRRNTGHLTDPNFASHTSDSLLREADRFFGIPVRYWPSILCALGIAFYFVND